MEMIRGRDWRRRQEVRCEIEHGGARTSGGDDWRRQAVGATFDAGAHSPESGHVGSRRGLDGQPNRGRVGHEPQHSLQCATAIRRGRVRGDVITHAFERLARFCCVWPATRACELGAMGREMGAAGRYRPARGEARRRFGASGCGGRLDRGGRRTRRSYGGWAAMTGAAFPASVSRIVWKGEAPRSLAVSTVVRTSASASAAHIAR